MTFDATEVGVASGQPIELYEFVGTNSTYRYTSYQKDVVSNDNTFTAVEGLERNAMKAGTQEDDQAAIDVTLPFDNTMANTYVFSIAPPSLQLSLYRVHKNDLNDTLLMWKGEVTSWTVEGRKVKLKVPTVFGYLLGAALPRPKFQGPCNHLLYDAFCAVVPTSFESVRTVSSVTENVIVLDSSPFSDDACNGGEMEFTSGGERRQIIDNVGTSFTVNYPFATLAGTDTVTIRQGCDHSFATCKSKFSNGISFGGCNRVPSYNPFAKSNL